MTTNNDRLADFSLRMARKVAGPRATVELPHPVMGAEDFSYVLNEVPGAMVFLGGTPHGANLSKAAPNHSNRVFFEESAMATGIALYASTTLRKLAVT
ncbi:MAG: hypothetical protein GKR86_01255 [Ilumatobacter sp.]|nr:hypothetical protein [Ilumatobacter sp.]